VGSPLCDTDTPECNSGRRPDPEPLLGGQISEPETLEVGLLPPTCEAGKAGGSALSRKQFDSACIHAKPLGNSGIAGLSGCNLIGKRQVVR
jgi:hypothetical protein